MKKWFYFLMIIGFLICSCSKQIFEVKHESLKTENLIFELKNHYVSKIEIKYDEEADFSKGNPTSTTIQIPCIRVYLSNEGHLKFKSFLINTYYKNGTKSFHGISLYANNVKIITIFGYTGLGEKEYIDFTFFDKDKNYINSLKNQLYDSRVVLKIE